MKMLNATWIAARSHVGFASLSGLTNSVQPYCKLAIRIMQTMTDKSCVHRVAVDAFAPTSTVLATLILSSPIFAFAPGSSGRRREQPRFRLGARRLGALN